MMINNQYPLGIWFGSVKEIVDRSKNFRYIAYQSEVKKAIGKPNVIALIKVPVLLKLET
jgi:hypothetical protein